MPLSKIDFDQIKIQLETGNKDRKQDPDQQNLIMNRFAKINQHSKR